MYTNQILQDRLCARADRLLVEIQANIRRIRRRIQELEKPPCRRQQVVDEKF